MSDKVNWDDFTPVNQAPAAQSVDWSQFTPEKPKGFLGQARDLGLAAARGAIAVPEVAVGAADILSGGRAGKALENQGGVIGFRPKQAKEFLSSLETDQTKAQRQEFADADGVLGKAGVALSNPSLIANTVVESAPTMLAGGLVGRGVKALGMTGSTAAAIGEGAVMASSAAEQMRQQTDDGLLTGKQTALALGTGAVGAAVGAAGNRLGQAFGDADTVLVNGIGRAAGATTAPTRGMAARVLGGSAVEGAEEVAQSVPEQMFQNAGLSRSLDEGVADAAVMGALSGGVMGAGAGVMSGRGAATAPTAQPGQEPAVQAAPESQPPAPAPDPLAAGFTPGIVSDAAPAVDPMQAASEIPAQQDQAAPAPAINPTITESQAVEPPVPATEDQAINAEADKRANRLAAVGVADPAPNSPLTNAALAAVDSGVHGIAMAEQQAATTSPVSAAQAEKPVGQQNAPTQAPLSSAAALAPLAESVAAPAPTPQQRLATLQTEIASGTDAQTGAKLNALQVGFRKAEARQIKQPPESETLAIGQSRATQPTQQPTQQDPAYVPELQNPSQKASPAPGAQAAQAAQSVAPAAPPQELTRAPEIAAGPARVLQNRDRSSVASIAQMNEIAAKPDYWRAGQSRVMENGAPVVFGSAPANALVGKADQIADGLGKRVPVQYAVVESADVLPSHQADGAPIAEYQNGMPGKLRAVAGNGRAAGIGEAYRRNTAAQYRQDLTDDAADLGIDPVAVRAMKAPVLVRVMPEDQVTDDIGDRSNIGGTAALSATEQAANDARRIDLSGLTFDDNGIPDRQSAAKFVNTMPVSERGTMMQPDGSPTRQLIDRITSAAFKAAYGNDDVVRLQAQSTDPEVRNIITAMASAAGQMAGLEGAGDFDIRGAVAEAAQMAVNAKRQGITLTDYLNNADITFSGEAFTVARFMADNIRSAKRMAEGLRAWANYAAEQVAIVRENEYQNAMFGATPTASRGDTFNQLGATNDQSSATQIQDGGNRVSRVADRAPRQEAQPAPEQNRPADSQEKPSQQDSAEKITQPEPAYVPQLQGAKQEKSPAPSAQTQQDTATEIDANGKAVEQIRTAELTYNTTKRLAAAYHGEAYKGKSEDYKTLRADLEERASDENFKGKSLAQDVLERFDDSIANLEQKQAAKKAEAPEGRRPAQEISIAPAAPEASPSTPTATPARPATWRKNYIQARAVAKSLGITPVKGVQLPGLLAEIDRTDSAARADPAAESAQDVANQAPAQTAPVPKSVSAKAQAANENKAKAAELREFNKEWRKKNKVGKFDTWEEMDKFRTARQESRDRAAAALKKGTEELKADFAKLKEQRETARAKAAALDTLTAPTPQDILDQQARAEAAAQTEKSQQRAADERARRERERKDIAKASTAAADTFELGGNAEQNLSGQQSVFDAPAEQAPAPKSKEVNNAREYGVQSAKISGRREAKDKKVQKYNAEEYAAYLEGFDAQTAADNARFERSKNNPNATTFPTANNLDMAAKFKAQDEARNAPTPAPKPAKQPNADKLRAEADLMNALADLGDIFSKPFKSHLTDEQTQKLMPVMTRLLDAAFRLGYIKFKDAAKFALDKIQAAYGDEVADAITLDHLQGAYIGMAGGKVGADTKRAVIDIEDKAEITAHTLTEPTEDDVPESPTTAPTPAPSQTLTQSLATAIEAGNMPKDNPALKKLVESFDGQPADQARMKQAQEELETAIAMTARKVVAKNEGDRSTFDALLRMYESQPNLNVRTSTSIANQAYSTPAPLAFLASRLAGITSATVVHEPTAGTGMLLIGADPKKAIVNELNDLRIGALEAQGFTPTQKDAATQQLIPAGARVDAVITNPPFGSVKDDAGKPTKIKVDGFNIGQIDHLIAARALEAMKQDGKATLILGANKATGGLSTDDRIFFNWLYANYNVTGHFEVNGDLYARQGAGWPVRVISINGRMKSGKFSPVAGTIQRADNWSEVYEKFTQSLKATNAPIIRTPDEPRKNPASVVPAPAPTGASRPQSGTASTGNVAGTSPRVVPDRAEPTAEPVGAGADEQRLNAQSYIPEPQPGAKPAASTRPAKPAGVAALDDAPKGNDFQLPYTTRSSRKDEGVLIPANMAQPTQDALSRLEDEVGDIDEFARKELGYKTVDELHGALMGLQVDSVATTIWQIKRGKAVVIADQTGIGKGRQAASIIRWAAKQGMTPVFISVKPSLFTDMYGDLADIGTSDINPFILNGNAWIAGEDGTKLFANKPATHKAALREIMDSGELPGDSNALFMTYSQINVENMQRGVLRALAPNAVFVLDESHNAAGASATGQFMIETLGLAKGVSYLSATYAKRPDNMPLYFKTDIGDAAADAEGLSEAMAAGGLSLQTVVSNNLVKAGQMFRRERSYDGVSIVSKFDTPNRALHERMSNEATKALRAIVSADKSFHSIFVKNLSKELASEGSSIKDIAGNQASASVQHTEFSSVVHNFVKQMLLGLKAQTAADEAIASLKRGEKPVIAVENTMGSFLNEYAAANNIMQSSSLGTFDYRTILSRALERTRVVVVTDKRGNDEKRIIPLSELDFFTAKAYQDAADVIDGLKLSIPVSPIDWMRAEIIRAGFSVAEITGRNLSVDYSDPKKPVLAAIEQEEQKDKVNTTRLFNSGKLDALILNVAGSTGISLHASEKFEDQRQRHMIVAQAAGDINIFMQMIGRVHRTGQVRLPKYSILSVDLPTEKRPTAVLSVKMKSLNANTSSNTESATSVKTADILNKYGDQIVQQYLSDNLELARALGLEDEIGGDTIQDDIARKATGRLALQPIETQHAFYDDAEAQYAGLIEYLNKTNQNDLEPRTFDFDAKETRQEVLFEGPDKSTPFGEDAIYGEYSIKAQGHPMKPEEIRAAMTENLNGLSPEQHIIALVDPLKTKFDAYRKTLSEGVQQETASQALIDGQQFMQSHRIGSTFRVDINGEPFNAVVINIRNSHKEAGNPFSLSKMQLTVAVNGALRSLTIPATQFKKIEVSTIAPFFKIEQLFKEQPANQRETAKIVTGNLLAAYGEIKGARGTIITFTKQDGTSEQGILLPKLFDYGKNTRGDYRLPTAQSALLFLQTSIDREIGRFGIASRDSVVRVIPHAGWGIRVQVPKSKLKGGKFFLDSGLIEAGGDFVSSGNIMVQTVTDKLSAIKVLDLLMKKQALYALPSMADEAKAAVDKKINLAFSRDPKSTTPGMTPAQVQAIADKISAGWTNAPQIVVAASMADQRIPQAARDEDQRQRAMGATGSPEGFVHAGKVYLLADQLTSPERAAEVLMHEALGHIGLQGVFGDGLKTILQQIATMRRADVTRKAEQYGLDMNNAADRLTAAEEVLAEMAQTQPEIGFVKRAVAAIRTWLRDNVPGFKTLTLTDAEIVRSYLLPARGWVERGAAAGVGGRAAFSRGTAQTETPAFKKWFGDSKVVDADGKPLVVYHGTDADFSEFKKENQSANSQYGGGFFFTSSPEVAGNYGAITMPVYLKAEVGMMEKRAARANGKSVQIDHIHSEKDGRDIWVVFDPNQIKSATSNNGTFDPANPDIRFSRSPAAAINARLNDKPETTLGNTGRYDEAQIQAMHNTGMTVTEKSIAERTKEFWRDTGKKLAQGLADQFAPIKEISKEAYGLARLAKGASGAFEALLQGGKLKLTDGVYDFDEAQRGGVVETLLKPMNGEHHDALRWVAANRAEQLMNESEATRAEGAALLAQASALNQQARALESAGKIPEAKKLQAEAEIKKSEGDKKKNVSRENLFTRDDIAALKRLSDGDTNFDYTIKNGIRKGTVTRKRAEIYKDFNATLNGFNRNVLDLTEKSGLIDPESRKIWERDFYVPFYRVSEDDGGSAGGANVSGSMVRQKAFERLKGGKQKLSNDLLDNVLMNWAHLLDASAKNRAAKATLEAAAAMPTPVAIEAPESTARSIASEIGKKNSVVWFMDSGKQRYFIVDDPYVLTAITALEYAGMRNPVMNAMGAFKHTLTVGVTASPFFKIRNLIRDSLQVVASAPLDYNVAKNIKQGFALTNPRSDAYFRLLAGGGTIHFGTMMEGSEGRRVQSLVESGVKDSTILNGDHKIKAFYQKYIEPGVTAYNELGNRGEAINRAALYDQLVKKGVSHADASLQARDLMDFSMQGSFTAVRFLTQVVPFMNARIQGLYKLGRAAKEDPRRMAVVLGATAAFSVALMTAYSDDDDWKKREEFDRNNFWWFKFGGEAFRIPKPFEIGAMATLAERGFELAFSKEMTSKRFMEQVRTLLSDNLSMSPIPQMFKPVIDVYANKDSFSGRPIEGMGMDKLRPEYRFSDRTSMLARGASSALNAATGVFDKDSLSPVQIDHMLRGYFGWLGSFVVGTSEIIARPATGQATQAAPDYWKMATGGIVSTLDGAQSRYVSSMYEQASRIEQDYGTWRAMIKEGKPLEAQEYRTENAASIGKYHRIEAAKKQTATLNQQIKIIERGNASSTEKRERITALRNQQNLIAKMAMSTE